MPPAAPEAGAEGALCAIAKSAGSERSQPLAALAALAVLLGALAFLFRPLLTSSAAILLGDNLTHSLPLNYRLADALHGGSWRFWEPAVAFGSPLYADGTAGWFHPWKLLLFATLPWLAAHDALYLSSFFLTGAFCYFLARKLGAGTPLALVAALAATFSPAVLEDVYNASYSHALAWSALCLLAFEHWYENPTRGRLVALGASIALSALASYPPTTYATLFFLASLLAIRLLSDRDRVATRLFGFPAAVALGIGLAAFQLLPLAELASHSVRQQAIAPLQAFPWQNYVGGLVFVNDPALYRAGRFSFFIAPLGTVLAVVGVAFLPLLRDRLALGYLVAIALCVGAAVGPGGLLFELFRVVLPGFDRLRLISPFLLVTVVPSAVVLALLLGQASRAAFSRREIVVCAVWTALFALFLAGSLPWAAALPRYRDASTILLAGLAAGLAALRLARRPAWAPFLFLLALLAEIAGVKGSFLTFLPDSLLAEGAGLGSYLAVRQREDPDARAVHLANPRYERAFQGLVLQHWKSPGYPSYARECMRTRTPYVNLLDDVSFAEANDALPLAGVPALRDAIQAELRGESGAAPGERLLDRFRVRFVVTLGDPPPTPVADGLDVVWRDPAGDISVLENRYVRPKYQWHPGGGAEDAAAPPVSFLERAVEALPWVTAESDGATDVVAPAAGRLFVPIPRFPGWTAFVDSRRVPILAAEGVGMDLPVSAGTHRVELRFIPYSFHLGLVIAGLTAAGIAIALLPRARAQRR